MCTPRSDTNTNKPEFGSASGRESKFYASVCPDRLSRVPYGGYTLQDFSNLHRLGDHTLDDNKRQIAQDLSLLILQCVLFSHTN